MLSRGRFSEGQRRPSEWGGAAVPAPSRRAHRPLQSDAGALSVPTALGRGCQEPQAEGFPALGAVGLVVSPRVPRSAAGPGEGHGQEPELGPQGRLLLGKGRWAAGGVGERGRELGPGLGPSGMVQQVLVPGLWSSRPLAPPPPRH